MQTVCKIFISAAGVSAFSERNRSVRLSLSISSEAILLCCKKACFWTLRKNMKKFILYYFFCNFVPSKPSTHDSSVSL